MVNTIKTNHYKKAFSTLTPQQRKSVKDFGAEIHSDIRDLGLDSAEAFIYVVTNMEIENREERYCTACTVAHLMSKKN